MPDIDLIKDIRIEDFDYGLPDELIARHPLEKRDECRLLVKCSDGKIFHRKFTEVPDLLPAGSMMICNDTKVIRARLSFQKPSGANIEIFLLEPILPSDYALNFGSTVSCRWKCLVGNLKKWKEGELNLRVIDPASGNETILAASRLNDLEEGGVAIEFKWNNPEFSFSRIIECTGVIPIPPYLHRESEARDNSDYQTVYAMYEGSVAAPTAGLHFTPEIFEGLSAHGVKVEKVTLHVGAGTFRPVKSDVIGDHDMHSERFSVSLRLLESLWKFKKEGRPVVAVGTTSVRTLESIPYIGDALKRGVGLPFHLEQWRAYDQYSDFDTNDALEVIIKWMKEKNIETFEASTAIMIAPGFKWRITDAMITNFHQPKSTLLLLVSSFLGKNDDFEAWKKVYDQALKEKYRFLSYGDACLFIRK